MNDSVPQGKARGDLMRLSEAIRLGAMIRPQCFGDLFREFHDQGSCALGAAYEAAGIPSSDRRDKWFGETRAAFPILNRSAVCPLCNCHEAVAYVVTHLNDEHQWTRERIADWVALIEPADESAESVDAVHRLSDDHELSTRVKGSSSLCSDVVGPPTSPTKEPV